MREKVLLISGGSDSMWIYNKHKDILTRLIYIDYGNISAKEEIQTINKIISKENRQLLILKIDKIEPQKDYFYPARNLKLILTVVDNVLSDTLDIYFGTNASDEYPDNNKRYMKRLQWLIKKSYNREIRILLPLINKTKKEILKETNIPFVYCDISPMSPCGKCHSCLIIGKYK